MHLARFKRVQLGHLPTPLEPMKNLSKVLGGPNLYVKRDDCTGLATGGTGNGAAGFLLVEEVSESAYEGNPGYRRLPA